MPEKSGEELLFHVNASQIKKFSHLENATKVDSAAYWISGIARGIMTLRANVSRSELYERPENVNGLSYLSIPLKKQKIFSRRVHRHFGSGSLLCGFHCSYGIDSHHHLCFFEFSSERRLRAS